MYVAIIVVITYVCINVYKGIVHFRKYCFSIKDYSALNYAEEGLVVFSVS